MTFPIRASEATLLEVRQALQRIELNRRTGCKHNWTATTNPGVTDGETEGYSAGSFWYNAHGTTGDYLFICTDATKDAAQWYNPFDGAAAFGVGATATAGSGHNFGSLDPSTGTTITASVKGDTATLTGSGGVTVTGDGDHTVTIDGVGAATDLSDVDTSGVALNKVLKWDGSNWVPGTAGDTTEFTFSIASFTDNEAGTQLIGSGVWEAAGSITFDATYENGPPSAASVTMSTNGGGGVWGTNPLVMTDPYDTKVTADATNYPTSKDTYITFTLNTTPSDSDTETVYFRNKIIWGSHATGNGLTEAEVEGLTGGSEAISNDTTRSMSLSSVSTNYLVFAHPASYTTIKVGSDYETDGHTGFTYNGIAVAMTLDSSTLSITNAAGFTEDYKVYVSDNASLGDHSLVSSSGNATIDPLYYGITVKTDTFLEADIEGLANNQVTNDNTQTWDSVTTGVGEYMLFAFPKRLGIPTFWVGGFEGGFEAPETVSVTNANGYTEDYYAWRSTNANLGATVVETQ